MLHGFLLNAKDLRLSIGGGNNPVIPLTMSACPLNDKGIPVGLVAINGLVHTMLPEGLPTLIAYSDGGIEIREHLGIDKVAEAGCVVSGSALLIRDSKRIEIDSPIDLFNDKIMVRQGVGVLEDGRLLFLVHKCTAKDLQTAFYTYGVVDAMMLAFEDVYLNYPRAS